MKEKEISQEELQRLFQESNKIYADEMAVNATSIDDIKLDQFKVIIKRINTYDQL